MLSDPKDPLGSFVARNATGTGSSCAPLGGALIALVMLVLFAILIFR